MLTGENWACKKDFVQIRKDRTPSTKCFTKPEHFVSCITVDLSPLLLLMKISRIYDIVKKDMRLFVTKCKEKFKLKTENLFLLKQFIWSKIYRVVNHSVNMGWLKFRLATFLNGTTFRKFRASCGQC